MTTPIHQVAEALVTQADREAAAGWLGTALPSTTPEAFDQLCQTFARHRLTTETRIAELEAALRLFPEAYDVLTRQEMRDAKGNWRSLIDQQTNALAVIRDTLTGDSRHGK